MRVTVSWTSIFLLCGCMGLLLAPAANAAVVYYVGDNAADATLANHIQNDLGHTVVQVSQTAGSYGGAINANADLIILSGSMSSGSATGHNYHISQIPILNFEAFSYDNFGWTGDATNVDYGDSATNKDTIQIDNAAHPITSGFSAGPLTVLSNTASDSRFTFGVVHADADVLATYQGGGTGDGKPTIFVYEKGDNLIQATDDNPAVTKARSRYIGFFLDYGTGMLDPSGGLYAKMNADGVKLFDQAVAYGLDYSANEETSLIAHWTFDEADDLADVVGDNHGTAMGGAAITTAAGESLVGDGALKLDNATTPQQFVKIDGMAGELLNGDKMTLSMWFNTEDTSDAAHQLFSAHTAAGGNIFRLGVTGDGDIFLNPTDIGGTHDKVASASTPLNDGQWHLLTVSALDTSLLVTVDGEVIGEGDFTSAVGQPKWSNATQFSIGQEYDSSNPTDFFDGLIDDVKVWNNILTMDEITAEYQSVIPEPCTFALLAMGLAMLFAGWRRKQ